MEFTIFILSLLAAIFLPDPFIKYLHKKLKEKLNIPKDQENEKWTLYPRLLGLVERLFFWLVWFLFKSQFIIFIGIWLALKVAGGYKNWASVGEDNFATHRGRASFMIFMICTSLSIISVIVIAYFTDYLIELSYPQLNPFSR